MLFRDSSNFYELSGSEVSVEIGDSKQPDFKPQVKWMRWNNQANLSIRAEVHPQAIQTLQNGIVKYISDEYQVWMYDKPEASDEGGFEFEWIIDQIPATNVFRATIQQKGLTFHKQEALTQEQIDEGDNRPDDVIGSYAVYFNRRDNEYRTGKFCHIYRPIARDSQNTEVYAELDINEKTGLLTVTVPWEFLRSAMYPVVVDPTFGYTTVGASTSGKRHDIRGSEGAPSANGTVDSISTYVASGWTSGEAQRFGIFDSSGNFIDETAESTAGGSGWITLNFSSPPSVTSGTTYLIGFYQDNTITYSYDSTSGLTSPSEDQGSGYPTWPDPVGTSTAFQFSVYATYSTAGTTYNDTVSETVTATDSSSNVVTFANTVSETITGTDSNASSHTMVNAITETVTATDNNASSHTMNDIVSETVTATDSNVGGLLLQETISDSITATDSNSATITFSFTLSDTLTATDTLSNTMDMVNSLSESVTATDTLSPELVITESISETLTATDSNVGGLLIQETISEAITANDNLANTVIFNNSISETLTATDNHADNLIIIATLTESLSATDSLANSLDIIATISETLTATDSNLSNLLMQETIAETLSAIDSLGAETVINVSITDALTLGDSITGFNNISVNITESVSASDNVIATVIVGASPKIIPIKLKDKANIARFFSKANVAYLNNSSHQATIESKSNKARMRKINNNSTKL